MRYKNWTEGALLKDLSATSENQLHTDVEQLFDSQPGDGGIADNGVQSRRHPYQRRGVLRMKVTDNEPDEEQPRLVLARELDYDSEMIFTSPDRPVLVGQEHDVDDIIYVIAVAEDLRVWYENNPVEYFAINEVPHGQIQHQLYGNVTQNGMGHGLPLAVPDLSEIET